MGKFKKPKLKIQKSFRIQASGRRDHGGTLPSPPHLARRFPLGAWAIGAWLCAGATVAQASSPAGSGGVPPHVSPPPSALAPEFPLLSNGKFRKPRPFPPFFPFGQPGLTPAKSGTYSANGGPKTIKGKNSSGNHRFPLLSNGRFPRTGLK
jgi:hypothetical protein